MTAAAIALVAVATVGAPSLAQAQAKRCPLGQTLTAGGRIQAVDSGKGETDYEVEIEHPSGCTITRIMLTGPAPAACRKDARIEVTGPVGRDLWGIHAIDAKKIACR